MAQDTEEKFFSLFISLTSFRFLTSEILEVLGSIIGRRHLPQRLLEQTMGNCVSILESIAIGEFESGQRVRSSLFIYFSRKLTNL